MNLNTIQTNTEWGEAAVDVNKNFQTVGSNLNQLDGKIDGLDARVDEKIAEVEKLVDDVSNNNKGIFTTLAKLQAAYPSIENKKGWYAFVDYTNPRKKYIVTEDRGSWTATGELHNVMGVNLNDYLRKEDVKDTTGTSTTQVMSQKSISDAVERRALTHREDGGTVVYLTPEGYLPNGVVPMASDQLDGLMSKEDKKQLNEIIESMKTDNEKYPIKIIVFCENTDKSKNLGALVNILTDWGKKSKYKIKNSNYSVEAETTAPDQPLILTTTKENDVFELYVSGDVYQININDKTGLSKQIKVVTTGGSLKLLNINNLAHSYIDLSSVVGIPRIEAKYTALEGISLPIAWRLEELILTGSNKFSYLNIALSAAVLKYLDASNCSLMSSIYTLNSFLVLEKVYLDGTAYKISGLEYLEGKWASRAGKETGLLRISQSLYELMGADLKKKFTDKNITIQF